MTHNIWSLVTVYRKIIEELWRRFLISYHSGPFNFTLFTILLMVGTIISSLIVEAMIFDKGHLIFAIFGTIILVLLIPIYWFLLLSWLELLDSIFMLVFKRRPFGIKEFLAKKLNEMKNNRNTGDSDGQR